MQTGLDVERTPDGRRLVVAREVTASREDAWELLTDTTRWPEWGPSVRDVDCDERYIREGTTGRVGLPGGLRIPFEITGCEPYRWTWRVARIPATGHRVGVTDGGSRVAFEVPLLAAGYAPVCQRALSRIASLLGDDGSATIPVPVETEN